MLKELIRGSFLLKISNSPCAVLHHSFTDRYLKWAHANISTISGPNPEGSQPPIWPHLCKEPLWLIFGFCCWLFFFFPCVPKWQAGKLPGFTPGSEGSMPLDAVVRRGQVGRSGGANTQGPQWYDLSWEPTCIHSFVWAAPRVYSELLWCRKEPIHGKVGVKGVGGCKEEGILLFRLPLYTFHFARPDSHQHREPKQSSVRNVPGTEHLALWAKMRDLFKVNEVSATF